MESILTKATQSADDVANKSGKLRALFIYDSKLNKMGQDKSPTKNLIDYAGIY